jgi:hypothetical protein
MASGVLKRTLHYEYDSRPGFECYRFSDWNSVITTLGVMLEPSQLVPRETGVAQLDWEDEMTKIDAIQDNGSDAMLTANKDLTIGYHLQPRLGR